MSHRQSILPNDIDVNGSLAHHATTSQPIVLRGQNTRFRYSSGPELRAQRAFVGAHLPLGDETPVSIVKLVFTHLADWVCGDKPFAHEELSEDIRRLHVDYDYPAPLEFRGLGGTISIATGSRWTRDLHSETVSREPFLFIMLDDQIPYRDVDDKIIKPFQYFLTFAYDSLLL